MLRQPLFHPRAHGQRTQAGTPGGQEGSPGGLAGRLGAAVGVGKEGVPHHFSITGGEAAAARQRGHGKRRRGSGPARVGEEQRQRQRHCSRHQPAVVAQGIQQRAWCLLIPGWGDAAHLGEL